MVRVAYGWRLVRRDCSIGENRESEASGGGNMPVLAQCLANITSSSSLRSSDTSLIMFFLCLV